MLLNSFFHVCLLILELTLILTLITLVTICIILFIIITGKKQGKDNLLATVIRRLKKYPSFIILSSVGLHIFLYPLQTSIKFSQVRLCLFFLIRKIREILKIPGDIIESMLICFLKNSPLVTLLIADQFCILLCILYLLKLFIIHRILENPESSE